MKKLRNIILITILFAGFSCEDLVTEEPVNIITDDVVINDEASAETALFGAYNSLQSGNMYHNQTIGDAGVLSDELIHSGSFPTVAEMDRNQVIPTNVTIQNMWSAYYNGIYKTNVILERIEGITIGADKSKQFIGEAKFLRALFHFDVMRYWGDAPLATSSDLATLKVIDRTPSAEIYTFLISELTESAALLAGVNHGNKNRANEWAAKALLARVQLYKGDKTAAGSLANDVITNGPYTLETVYDDIFAGNSDETILEVFSSVNDQNGIAFQFRKNGRYEYAPAAALIAAYEGGDARFSMIDDPATDKPEAAKYLDVATGTDKSIILRLSEMYLIRAEANIGNASADNDVNEMRSRAGLGDLTNVTIDDILQERFVEFTFEGHRWFDLVRTGKADAVMSVINPSTWTPTAVLLPIPQREIQQNPTLVGKQNPGY